jgi:hypothetical protein
MNWNAAYEFLLADVEKLVLLHDDGLIPRLVVQAQSLAHTVSLVRLLGSL